MEYGDIVIANFGENRNLVFQVKESFEEKYGMTRCKPIPGSELPYKFTGWQSYLPTVRTEGVFAKVLTDANLLETYNKSYFIV